MEELEFIIEACEESMSNAIKHLEKELLNIRAGKANPSMLSSVKLDYYGSTTPLSQIANINTPDAGLYHLPFTKILNESKGFKISEYRN